MTTRDLEPAPLHDLPRCDGKVSYPKRVGEEVRNRRLRQGSMKLRLCMDLKAINEETPGASPSPYPQSYNPDSPVIEPTADGIKL